MKPGH